MRCFKFISIREHSQIRYASKQPLIVTIVGLQHVWSVGEERTNDKRTKVTYAYYIFGMNSLVKTWDR